MFHSSHLVFIVIVILSHIINLSLIFDVAISFIKKLSFSGADECVVIIVSVLVFSFGCILSFNVVRLSSIKLIGFSVFVLTQFKS
jgi:hypothetical protein